MKKLSKYCTIGLYLVFIGMVVYHVFGLYFLVLILAMLAVFCTLLLNKKNSKTILESSDELKNAFGEVFKSAQKCGCGDTKELHERRCIKCRLKEMLN